MNISASQNPEAGFQYSGIHFRSLSNHGIFSLVRSSRLDRKLEGWRCPRPVTHHRRKTRDETDSRERPFQAWFHFILGPLLLLQTYPPIVWVSGYSSAYHANVTSVQNRIFKGMEMYADLLK